jgi:ABC-type transport system involved in cytochrome bd biosynthesis fused ATPase/permease subunit
MNSTSRWPLERVLFALAGTVTLLSVALVLAVSKWFLLLTAFVGVNQWLYVTARACPASIILSRTCRLRSAVYRNDERPAAHGREVAI